MNQYQSPFIGIGLRHPHYAQVLEEHPAVDFLEVHAENFFAAGGALLQVLDDAASAYPVSLHGVGLSLGSAQGLDTWHLQKLAQLVARTNPMLVSDHACFARAHIHGAPVHANDLLPIRWTRSSLDVLCSNVHQVQDTLKRNIAVENISAYIHWQEADFSETEFLNTLCQRTGCGLLLDLNNIYVNAFNQALLAQRLDKATNTPQHTLQQTAQALSDCVNWVNEISPESVMEIHLAGFTPHDTLVIDDHACKVHDAVWQLYQHTLKKMGHIPTLIEWDLELPELPVLLNEANTARQYALAITS